MEPFFSHKSYPTWGVDFLSVAAVTHVYIKNRITSREYFASAVTTLNELHGVSNYRQLDCFNILFMLETIKKPVPHYWCFWPNGIVMRKALSCHKVNMLSALNKTIQK